MASEDHRQRMFLGASIIVACSGIISSGCADFQAVPGKPTQGVQLYPATANLVQGNGVRFTLNTNAAQIPASRCTWKVGDSAILSPKGNGEFVGTGIGSSSVTANCDGISVSSSVLVSPTSNPTSITITSGGTYSGTWSSNDPKVPAVTVITNEPVTIRNSTLTGKGSLILIYGSQGGANVNVDNVTGRALDPGVAGMAKGKFLGAEVVSHLSVTHCTMHGVSFGVYVAASTPDSLIIKDNIADNLDDRESDGHGGYLLNQRTLGHLIQFNNVSLPNGAEVAWNQMTNSEGVASVEDLISLYQSHGAPESEILIHDNYLQGAFASGQTVPYTGGGIQMDGSSNDPSTANGFVQIYNNIIVHLAGFGISIAAGHDISVTGNRIVSCGKDSAGNWIEHQGGTALGMWNYYKTNQYYNNYVGTNSGGLVGPDANGNPSPGNIDAPSASVSLKNIVGTNVFEQPCITSSGLNLAAESAEKIRWLESVSLARELLGDQH